MTSTLRTKHSQSYIAPSEFDTSYVKYHTNPRLLDESLYKHSATYNRHRSVTLSSTPRHVASPQRHSDHRTGFPSMWSPPPSKSISASLSPKHAEIRSSQYNYRPLSGKDNLFLSSSGLTQRQNTANASCQRINQYPGNALGEYASGDSGGSNSSYRKRNIDQKKYVNAPSSIGMSGDVSIMRTGYERFATKKYSTLPYKRRGSWHFDRESNFSSSDWSSSPHRRSFSPERLVIDTPRDFESAVLSSETRSLRLQSLHKKHIRELTKSTDQLSTGFLDNYSGTETSFSTLRARLDAASTQMSGFRRQASADHLYGVDLTAGLLRRQCERQHRRLLKNLMSDSWELRTGSRKNSFQQFSNPELGGVLPVQEATLLTAPRTVNQLADSNLKKLLVNPSLIQSFLNNASHAQQPSDQSSLADQVTLAAVAGAAAATAMANFTNPSPEHPPYSNFPVPTTSTVIEYDWNDPQTLIAAYKALAEASGGEKAFLEQLSPELAATLVHYREQLSDNLTAGDSKSDGNAKSLITAPIPTSTSAAILTTSDSGVKYIPSEAFLRQSRTDKEADASSAHSRLISPFSDDATSRIRGKGKISDSTPTKIMRKTHNFPTKRLLLMRSSKSQVAGDNDFGLKITGGRKRSDGQVGSYVERIYSEETLSYLHGEISEGDEVIEWNGISLVGKSAMEVQTIVDTPADDVELLVRISPSETLISNPFAQHTCSSRIPITDNHSFPPKFCPSHNSNLHPHDNLHMDASSGGISVHQQHACQQSHQTLLRPPIHTCEVHLMGPPCIHKKQQQHVCRSADWPSDSHGGWPLRCAIDRPSPNSPHSERNAIETPARLQRLVPTVKVAEYDAKHGERRDEQEAEVHSGGGQTKDNGSLVNSEDDSAGYGKIELILTFDDYDQSLTIHVARAKGLRPMDLNGLADPFVKLRLHPDPTEDMDLNRQTKYISNTLEPEWQQTVVFMNCLKRTLKKRVLEITVWDFDRLKMNDFMGQAIVHLGLKGTLDGQPHWFKLHALQDIVIPGYRQPGTRSVAPPISQNDQMKSIKLVKEVKTPQGRHIQKY